MNLNGSQYLHQMKAQITITWSQKCWHWPSPFAYGMLPNPKSNSSDQAQQSTKHLLEFLLFIRYFKVLRPQAQTKYTNKYIQSQYMAQMSKVKMV